MAKKEETKKENPNAKWYVLNIRTGYENSIQKELKRGIEATGMEDKIVDILVPTQKKIFVKKGKQDVKEEKIFPGYVLVKMELDNKTWIWLRILRV
jgi:transcriptional antiterminator NusG